MAKRYEELDFSDDFMFCKILVNNEDICMEMIEMIEGRKISEISNLHKQSAIEITPDGKGIRLDVIFEGDDKIYDIEITD
jgi:hypothetical protein